MPVRSSSPPQTFASEPAWALEVARNELLGLPARLLALLPLRSRIRVQHAGTKSLFDFELGEKTTEAEAADRPLRRSRAGRARRPHGRSRALCAFDAEELEALAMGAEVERTFGSDLTAFALRKQHDPSFRVTLDHALAGAYVTLEAGSSLSFGELLQRLELSIVGIELITDAPAPAIEPAAA
jgi:hypothetical protein